MQVPEQQNPIQREIIILLVILGILGCLFALLVGGGYFYYQQYTETQTLSGTATSAFMATKIKQDTEAQATIQAQASATAQALQAQATATALAKNAELMKYKYFDPFVTNESAWREGEEDEDNEYWRGNITIEDGTYNWQVAEVLEPFVAWSDFPKEETFKDFDAAVLARRQQGEAAEYCYGLLFRKSPEGFDAGAYIFTVCENGYFTISYYDEANPWEEIQGWTETSLLNQNDWNLLEISARGSDFTLSINHQQVAEFNDERLTEGLVAILIDVYEKQPGSIQFDNFALQPR